MSEIHIPLIPLGISTNPWYFSNGRLHGNSGAQTQIIAMLPDGVFLKTLRIKGFLGKTDSLFVQLYRTPKDDFGGLPSVDPIVTETIPSPPGGIVNESISLTLSGKNVVDNAVYNYAVSVAANTTGPLDYAFIGEIALLY